MSVNRCYHMVLLSGCAIALLVSLVHYFDLTGDFSESNNNEGNVQIPVVLKKPFKLAELSKWVIVQEKPLFSESRLPYIQLELPVEEIAPAPTPFEYELTGIVITQKERMAIFHSKVTNKTKSVEVGNQVDQDNPLWVVTNIEVTQVSVMDTDKNEEKVLTLKKAILGRL